MNPFTFVDFGVTIHEDEIRMPPGSKTKCDDLKNDNSLVRVRVPFVTFKEFGTRGYT